MDSGVIKELSMKISSHLNPLEPKGMHPFKKQENENGIDKEVVDKLEGGENRK